MPDTPIFLYQRGSESLYGSNWGRLKAIPADDAWKNALLIPLFAALISGGCLFLQILGAVCSRSRRTQDNAPKSRMAVNDDEHIEGIIDKLARTHGGMVIYVFKLARFLCCLALFALSLATAIGSHGHWNLRWDTVFRDDNLPKLAVVVTFWYSSFLAFLSIARSRWSQLATRHNNVVLLAAFAVYVYRDIWPLATYSDGPMDITEGYLLWAKVAVLTVVAVIIPLFIPRQYVPVDPKNPMKVLNPEQTASLFSLLVYGYLDPVVFEAYRAPHLPHDRLPPLADYDSAKYITERSFSKLDIFRGAKKRHLFFGLMRVFFWDYAFMTIPLVVNAIAGFASPLVVNRILTSLETSGEGDYVRPWAWIVFLFFGHLLASVSFNWYFYLLTWTLVQAQSILTELVLEHSLRIRFKAEPSSEGGRTRSASGVATPVEPSVETTSVDSTTAGGGSQESTRSESSTATTKRNVKATPKLLVEAEAAPEEGKKKDNLVGRINTLVTVDLDNIIGAKDFIIFFVWTPLELTLAITFLYIILGWSALVGCASIVLLLPVPGYLANLIQKIQDKKMAKTDARVEVVTETIGVLRMVKMFGWETKMSNNLKDKRGEELAWLWKSKVISLLNNIVNFLIPTVTMLVTYAIYTLIMKQSLSASKVFSSMTVFDMIRNLLHLNSWAVAQIVKGKVSLDRFGDFLTETELLDTFADEIENKVDICDAHNDHESVIGFKDAVFTWSKEVEDGTQTPSGRSFKLRIEGNLAFQRNVINLIVGPTGCGKTSILMALLGEMHFVPSNVDSWFNLPRSGGVAYASQESWVQNETIRDNILFGSPYDEERYQKVIYQCALKRDLELFEAGDKTEVGEKGLTLSGGQKARVTLARAVYSSAEIILLDDVLAPLDVHTSKWIVDECLKGDLIRGRTVLLVTHNVALAVPIADFIVTVGTDGVTHEVGADISAVLLDPALAREVAKEREETKLEVAVVDEVKKDDDRPDGRLILAEEIAEGRVTWKAMMLFLKGLGGKHPIYFMAAWLIGLALMHGGNALALWFLGFWGSQYETHDPAAVRVSFYISIYSAILLGSLLTYVVAATIYNLGTIRASRTINAQLMDSILRSTLRWLDETPASRIISRCTQDIGAIDGAATEAFGAVVELAVCMIVKLAGPVIFTPIFLLPGIVIALVGIYVGNIYLKAQMSVKRELSNARSPVLAHFGAAIAGLVSIRAYGAQQAFKTESLKRIDHFAKISRTSFNLNRWVSVRIDLLGSVFTVALASYLLVHRTLSAANIGFSLNMAVDYTLLILSLVRWYNEFEVQANSFERIQGYLEIEHEPRNTQEGKPPAAWPTSGHLRVEGLSARYSPGGPKVLHDISFEIKPGERIGIVGRTGSGKSSLTLSLLRCILTEGTVYYDDLPTSKINLDDLRSNITIIPQMPELLSGTLRRNLDPFEQHDDAALNNSLRAAGLFSLQSEGDDARLTLDSDISSGGNNLSVGQRQIIALARAIVRNSKLLILDEATSAIDHKTDSIIQSSLRNELGSDVTVLTVAHRLQTIMDADKIMVLDEGRIVEFDSPQTLLQKKEGQFKALVDDSVDKKALYSMAEQKGSGSR